MLDLAKTKLKIQLKRQRYFLRRSRLGFSSSNTDWAANKVQDAAEAAARSAYQQAEWDKVESGLPDARLAVQNNASDSARTAYQQSEWDKVQPSITEEALAIQDAASDAARSAYQQAVWDTLEPNISAAREAAVNEAIDAAKNNPQKPIVYIEGVPETLDGGDEFLAQIKISGMPFIEDFAANPDAVDPDGFPSPDPGSGTGEVEFSLPSGIRISGAIVGNLYAESGSQLGANDINAAGYIGYFGPGEPTFNTTGTLFQVAIRNATDDPINLSDLSITNVKIGEDEFDALIEEEIRAAVYEDFTEEAIKENAGNDFDNDIAYTVNDENGNPETTSKSIIRATALTAFNADPNNTEAGVKAAAGGDFDADVTYTIIDENGNSETTSKSIIRATALAAFNADPNNTEQVVRANAGSAFDNDVPYVVIDENGESTTSKTDVRNNAGIDFDNNHTDSAIRGRASTDFDLDIPFTFTNDNGEEVSIQKSVVRDTAAADFMSDPAHTDEGVRNDVYTANCDNEYATALTNFHSLTGNGEEEVRQAAIQAEIDAGNPRPTAPSALYQRLLSQITDLEQTIETNVAAEIQALGVDIEVNVAGQLQALIDSIGLDNIVTKQAEYAKYLADKKAYDDDQTLPLDQQQGISEPQVVNEPATMLARLLTAIETGDNATKNAVLSELGAVKTVVDKLDSEFITVAEFVALDSSLKGQSGVDAGNSLRFLTPLRTSQLYSTTTLIQRSLCLYRTTAPSCSLMQISYAS